MPALPASPDPAALLDAAPVPLLRVHEGQLQWLNAAARRLLGVAAGQPQTVLWTEPARAQALWQAEGDSADLGLLRGGRVRASSQALPDGGWLVSLQLLEANVALEAPSQLALAIDLGRIAVWRLHLPTMRLSLNQHAWDVIGQTPRSEGLSLDELRALTHPDDQARITATGDETLQTGRITDIEARYRRSDGSWRSLLMRRAVERAADGTPLALVGVGMDVTDHADQRRRADEMTQRFDLVTRTAGIGYWLFEHQAGRAHWSEQLRQLFGLAPGAPVPLLHDWLDTYVHPADRDALKRRFGEWSRGGYGYSAQAFRIVRGDGSVRHVMTHSRVEKGARGPMLFGVVMDLTERRNAEQALRSSGERAALAARGVGLGTWEQDLQTGETHWDAQMWALRGLPPQQQAMDEAARLANVHPADRERAAAAMRERLTVEASFEHEFRVIWPDGRVRWLASRSLEQLDDHSGQRRRIGVNWDVTDKRNAEAARQDREIAQRESLAKSQFLARMSHELRTPLNAVLGFSQLLLGDEHSSDAAANARRRKLEHIRTAGQHLLTMINDVLDLSSLEGGELPLTLQAVALAPLVAQTITQLEVQDHATPRARVRSALLHGSVMADPARLRQVLLHLLQHALKTSPADTEITIDTATAGDAVLLRVSDQSRGLSETQLRHLFEPFHRGDSGAAGAGDGAGNGVGLAIVKALVERMGGQVQVRSQIGVGSVFELQLPGAPAADAQDAVTPLHVPRRGHHVLYIEDNPVNAMIISELLSRRSDIWLHVAPDGSSGVQQATTLRPDLVLLDMQLPDFDGFEVLRRLRAAPATAGIPVIALSANAMPADIDRALRAGMADYWTKPLDFKAFLSAIDKLFGKAPEDIGSAA